MTGSGLVPEEGVGTSLHNRVRNGTRFPSSLLWLPVWKQRRGNERKERYKEDYFSQGKDGRRVMLAIHLRIMLSLRIYPLSDAMAQL